MSLFHRKYLNSPVYEVEVLISDHELVHNGCGMRLTSVAPRADLCFSRAKFQDEDLTCGLRNGANTFILRREEKPTRRHSMVYWTYNTLNMFRALLCPSSGARDYMCVITAYGVQCLVAGCLGSGAGQQPVRTGRGMLHDAVVQHI